MTIYSIKAEIQAAEQRLAELKEELRKERLKQSVERVRAEPGGLLYMGIGITIKKARTNVGLTQEDLSKQVGVTRTSIVNIEKGRQRLTIDLLYDIADALGIQAASLLPRNEDV